MNNPYTPGSPVDEASMFFGRAIELSEIRAFLNGGQSISIVGPHRIGKTSLMRHLTRASAASAQGKGADNLLVYISCQALSSSTHDVIFDCFCAEMAAALHAQELDPEPALEAGISAPARAVFEAAVRKLNLRGLRVVLMLDDFEQLTMNPHLDVNFYNALRSAAGRLRLVFLTSSTRPLFELAYFENAKKILSSPFFNIFAQLFLGLLTESEARKMVRAPMEAAGIAVSGRLADFIYQLAGGHPFALQIACSHAWDHPEDLLEIEQKTVEDLEPYCQNDWQNLSPAEREFLCNPAEASAKAAGNPGLTVILRDLTRKCLLVEAGGSYRYPSKAWAEFIQPTGGNGKAAWPPN